MARGRPRRVVNKSNAVKRPTSQHRTRVEESGQLWRSQPGRRTTYR